jgi:hypothetical protein
MKSAIAALALAAGLAQANIVITEVFIGLNGEDGTQDWYELTNTGTTAIDLTGWRMDDSSASFASGVALSGSIAAGQSAIFVIGSAAVDNVSFANSIAEFQGIWNYSGQIASTSGSGVGLSQDGDGVNIFNAGGTLIDSMSYGAIAGTELFTVEIGPDGQRFSVLGENGAYQSDAFFNDNLGLPGNSASLVGSPGVVPVPGVAALLALGGIAAGRRRR